MTNTEELLQELERLSDYGGNSAEAQEKMLKDAIQNGGSGRPAMRVISFAFLLECREKIEYLTRLEAKLGDTFSDIIAENATLIHELKELRNRNAELRKARGETIDQYVAARKRVDELTGQVASFAAGAGKPVLREELERHETTLTSLAEAGAKIETWMKLHDENEDTLTGCVNGVKERVEALEAKATAETERLDITTGGCFKLQERVVNLEVLGAQQVESTAKDTDWEARLREIFAPLSVFLKSYDPADIEKISEVELRALRFTSIDFLIQEIRKRAHDLAGIDL